MPHISLSSAILFIISQIGPENIDKKYPLDPQLRVLAEDVKSERCGRAVVFPQRNGRHLRAARGREVRRRGPE